jgi:hypothetical protein
MGVNLKAKGKDANGYNLDIDGVDKESNVSRENLISGQSRDSIKNGGNQGMD